jgi:subtilisin family serine protease
MTQSNTANATQEYMTGTSMSSPLVAGIASTILGQDNTKYNTISMCNKLISISTQASIQNLADPQFVNAPGSPNVIAYNGNGI